MTDKIYQDLMKGLKTNNNVKRCCSMEGLYEKLKDIFISNAQFLEILSQIKDI